MHGNHPRSRSEIEVTGLSCYATHFALSAAPPVAEIVERCQNLGASAVCVSGLQEWNSRTLQDYQDSARLLNQLGSVLRGHGISTLYHNHEFEFVEQAHGWTGIDVLLSELDPLSVSLCFDAGWAQLVGHDPARFIGDNHNRIGLVHLRDFKDGKSVALGQGEFDLTPIISALSRIPHLDKVMIEQDPGLDPIGDMVESRRFVREKFGI